MTKPTPWILACLLASALCAEPPRYGVTTDFDVMPCIEIARDAAGEYRLAELSFVPVRRWPERKGSRPPESPRVHLVLVAGDGARRQHAVPIELPEPETDFDRMALDGKGPDPVEISASFFVTLAPDVRAIEIEVDGRRLTRLERPARPPEVTVIAGPPGSRAVSWTISRAEPSRIWRTYHIRRGDDWIPLMDLNGGPAKLADSASLDPGDTRFKLLVTDGFHLTEAELAID
jgi:hypothetical protein